MEKVIKGKRYNTETAEFLGCYAENLSHSLNRVSEELYRKRSGEYFLYGSGGPMTKYGVPSQETCSGSDVIKPMSYEQAKKWAEENLTAEEYEKAFGKVDEDDGKIQKIFMLTKDTEEALKRVSANKRLSLSETVSDLILREARKMDLI